MNTRKKNKRRKELKKDIKSKTKDGQAEVFVLPPDLLQKLGIDLGSVGSSLECPTYNKGTTGDFYLNGERVISDNGKESDNTPKATKEEEIQRDTILETAELMKKSVFLSPTFVTAGNMDTEELEISNVIELKEINEATKRETADTTPTQDAADEPFPQMSPIILDTQLNSAVISHKKSTCDSDISATERDTTKTMFTQVTVAEPLPQIDKMSVIVNVQKNAMEINSKQITTNPESDTEKSNCLDSNFNSFSIQNNYQIAFDSNTIKNTQKCDIKTDVKINTTDTISTQVAVYDPFPLIDKSSVIDYSINATDISDNKQSTLNPDSDIEISNSSDSNFILLPMEDIYQINIDNNPVTDIPEKCVRARSTEDHPDEAYLSDCSNRTISPTDIAGSVSNILKMDSLDFNMPTECSNKVKIISEEILSPSKLKNLQIMLSPKKSSFIPVSMNCILEKKDKLRENNQNSNNLHGNLTNTCVLPANYDSSISKKIDLLALYDEKGNNISVIKNSSSLDIITDVKIEDLSQSTEQTLTEQDSTPELHTPEHHTFGDIDLVVIGMDIEENEDILENFVHEITSNDDNNILKKIEQSEKYCSPIKQDFEHLVQDKLGCTDPENKVVGMCHQSNNNMDEVGKLALESNTTKNISNELNLCQTNDKVLQVLEMVTNCNNNIMQTNLVSKNIELDKGNLNKRLNFETEMVNIKPNDIKMHSMHVSSKTSSNNIEKVKTEIECTDLNDMPFTSNVIEEKYDNVLFFIKSDKTRYNGFININDGNSKLKVLNENAKHTENKDSIYLNINEGHENRNSISNSNNKSNAMNCTVNDNTTIFKRKSEDIEINTSVEKYTKKLSKVKEIAMYLSQFAKNHYEVGKIRRNSVTNIKISAKRSKHNALTTKVYIQGVEKPGGSKKSDEDFKVNKVERTYTRSDKSHTRSVTRPLVLTHAKESENISLSLYEHEDSNNLIQEGYKDPEFCLCGDFGRMAYYDSDFPYEHIHFWEHKLVYCDRENVFSIFNDPDESDVNIDSQITNISEFSESQDQSSKTFVNSICWHSCKKVPIPNQNNENVSIIKDTTQTNEVTVLSKADDMLAPMQVCNDNKSTSVCEFQPKNVSIAVSQESEQLKIDFNTSKAILSPRKEKDFQSALPVKHVQTSNEIASPKKKRRKSEKRIEGDKEEPACKKSVKCDVCKKVLSEAQWEDHVSIEHCYIAWRSGSSFDFQDRHLLQKLLDRFKTNENFKCTFCGAELMHPKKFIKHVQQCFLKLEDSSEVSITDKTVYDISQPDDKSEKRIVVRNKSDGNKSVSAADALVCGVCGKHATAADWMNHIQRNHEYLAWKVGDTPLNFDNEDTVRIHLLNILKEFGELKCSKCRFTHRCLKSYMQHILQCNGKKESKADQTVDNIAPSCGSMKKKKSCSNAAEKPIYKIDGGNKSAAYDDMRECAVCKEIVSDDNWMEHIRQKHEYLAWRTGDPPLNLDNKKEVRIHLLNISRAIGELTCAKCGRSHRYPKSYMQHIQQCTGKNESRADQTDDDDLPLKVGNAGEQTVENLPKVNKIEPLECGVCKDTVAADDWMEHIKQKHEYLAWKTGDPPLNLDNTEEIRVHLLDIVRITGELTCSKCGLARRYPKTYMQHIQQCTGKDESQDDSLNMSTVNIVPRNRTDSVKCAVCSKDMLESQWMQHILDEHQYMAWREGDQPLNMEDAEAMKTYLYNICKETGGLTCNKCGLTRKYVKVYLHHIESCTGPTDNNLSNETVAVKAETNYLAIVDQDTVVTCVVCHKEVSSAKWIQHIGRAHNYMANYEGQSLDLSDQEAVYTYLCEVVKRAGHLVCSKCGLIRKYTKTFIQHTNICDAEGTTTNYGSDGENQETDGKLVCAVCSKEMEPKKWKQHKMDKHYNIAWTVGSIPVDVRNANVIDMLLKEYVDKYKKMVCKLCNDTRVSRLGFYAHVIQCGKTEEEIDAQKTVCGICNKKYLYIYHNQHMTWHGQQEMNVQRKLKMAEEQKQRVKEESLITEDSTPGRRRAAQKAKNVIENLKNDDFAYKCPTCKFGGDSKEEILNHLCRGNKEDEAYSDSGESAKVGEYSDGEESEDSIEVDSDVSNEETEDVSKKKKKKKYPAYTQTKRFAFEPQNLNLFLKKAGAEFLQQHFANDILFPNLRVFDCEPVPSEELSKYLPPLEESCKVKFGNDEWTTYRRFQVETRKCINAKLISVSYQCLFTGGYIQCVSWSRPAPDIVNSGGNFLAVACHQGSDVTRLQVDETPAHPGLIQLWSFGDFTQEAELPLCVAHEYGSAWALDWCPASRGSRLGLLAVAFSSGVVAVFAIPYPSSLVKRDKVIQKLKPVAELRQTMNIDREIYQATSVSWSKQKPYESIIVGYSDGTTGYFDLNTESPFLKAVENGVIVLYPYHDERVLNKCVTGLDLYPSVDGVGPAGAACCSSASGVTLLARPGVRPARQHISSAIGAVQFEPLWPSAVLVGDEANLPSAVNEIEWFGGGRRMGGASAGAGCNRCGRFVFAASPLLCVRYPHPADNRAKKQVAGILRMTPFAKKRKKLLNDELQTKVEPTTYEDAIRKYGIELRLDKESVKKAANLPRDSYPERFPERFPLGDVTSMAFCPDVSHHKKLAVATHSGMLFVIEV